MLFKNIVTHKKPQQIA